MTTGYTPYLHLSLDGSAEDNRNWAILDAKALDLARNLIANIPAGGDLTGFYPDPLIRDQAVTDPKIVSVSWTKITGVPPSIGTPTWQDTGTFLLPAQGPTYRVEMGQTVVHGAIQITDDVDAAFPIQGRMRYADGHFQGFNATAAWVNLDEAGGGGGDSLWFDDADASLVRPLDFFGRGIGLSSGREIVWADPSGEFIRQTGLKADDITLRLFTGAQGMFIFNQNQAQGFAYLSGAGNLALGPTWTFLNPDAFRLSVEGSVLLASTPASRIQWGTLGADTTLLPRIALDGVQNTLAYFAPLQHIFTCHDATAGIIELGSFFSNAGTLGFRVVVPTTISTGALTASEMLNVGGAIVLQAATNPTPVNGTLQFAAGKFQGRAGGAWVDIPGSGGGGSSLWRTDAAWEYITPDPPSTVVIDDGFALRWVDTATDPGGVDHSSTISGGAGSLTLNATNPAGSITFVLGGTGWANILLDHAQLEYGLTLGTDRQTTPLDGTLQFTGTTFQGRVGGAWVDIPGAGGGGGPPTGPAGGALMGTYPNPGLASQVIVDANISFSAGINWTKMAANGSVGGDLGGTMPNPTVLRATNSTGALGTQNFITATTTIATAQQDNIITANTLNITVTMPAWSGTLAGQTFRFSRADGQTARIVSIAAAGGDFIDGGTSVTIAPSESITLMALATQTSGKRWVSLARQNWVNVSASNSITPLDQSRMLFLQAAGDTLQFGSRAAKGRLISNKAADTFHSIGMVMNANYGPTGSPDDSTAASWQMLMRSGSTDSFIIQRAPPTATTPVMATLLTLDSVGRLTLPGDPASGVAMIFSPRTIKGRILANQVSDNQHLSANAALNAAGTAWVQDDITKPSWVLTASMTSDAFLVQRVAPGQTASQTPFQVDGAANASVIPIDGTQGSLTLWTYGLAFCSPYRSRVARGTISAPTAILLNDILAAYTGGGNFGAGAANISDQGTFRIVATENWSSTARGTYAQILTTPAGSTSQSNVFQFDAVGNLSINGPTGTKSTGTTWNNPSDRRLKDNIADYLTGLAAIKQLQPRTFTFNGLANSPAGLASAGFIADEVQPVMPEMVGTMSAKLNPEDPEPTDIQTLDQSNLILALVNAVKELATRLEVLEAK